MFIAFNDSRGRATIVNMLSVHCEQENSGSQPQYRMLINDCKETHIVFFPSAENLKTALFNLRDAIIAKDPFISFTNLESKEQLK